MAMLARRDRVVVTGFGILAANGIGTTAFWNTLLAAKSGIGHITLFDASNFLVRTAGEVKNFDFRKFNSSGHKPNRLGRHTKLALAAMKMAVEDSGLDAAILAEDAPINIIMGVSTSAIEVIEHGKDTMISHGPSKVSPYIVGACQPQAVASAMVEALGVPARAMTVSTACAAGIDAVAAAVDMIRKGRAEVAICGGTDSPINPLTIACFGATGMPPQGDHNPQEMSRPFDRDREGGVLAEGACVMVVESVEHALARGARPLMEIGGFATCVDSPGMEAGEGLAHSMELAIANSGCRTEDIDYICAHGPGHPVIDRVETAAIKKLFGDYAFKIPISSIKGVIGNPLSAAGPLQLATCALSFQHGIIPPTANLKHKDEHCDLDYVPLKSRRLHIRRALVNVHGLGGGNSSMVVNRMDMS